MLSKLVTTIRTDLEHLLEHWRSNGTVQTLTLLHSRDAPATAQFGKYVICGFAATFVQIAIAMALAYTVLPAMDGMIVDGEPISDSLRERNLKLANLAAFPVANIVAYALNALWVFTPGRHSRGKEFGLFTVISLISFTAGLFGGPELIGWFGIPSWTAQIGFMVTSALVNFVCRKFLVFEK